MDDDREARLGLACVVEAGDARLAAILADHSPGEVWARLRRGDLEGAWSRRAAGLSTAAVVASTERHGLRFIVPEDEEWPDGLDDLDRCEPVQGMAGAPVGLWVTGDRALAGLVEASLAVVGSRASSAYGDRVASDWAAELAGGGVTVVSGGAYGIDAAAHRGALSEGGPTLALLANGLDVLYPRSHEGLLSRVRDGGLLVSEYPPGEHPTRMRFLARNRLIAALGGATIIVEAAARSGARNTVTWANACGRPVGAVPGPVGSAQSYTPHRLVREGEAVLVASAAQVRELLAPMGEAMDARPAQPRLLDSLGTEELSVYEALPARGSREVGDLAVRAGVPVRHVLSALGSLASAGMVAQAGEGRWKLGPVENRPVRSAQQDGE